MQFNQGGQACGRQSKVWSRRWPEPPGPYRAQDSGPGSVSSVMLSTVGRGNPAGSFSPLLLLHLLVSSPLLLQFAAATGRVTARRKEWGGEKCELCPQSSPPNS